MQTAKRDRAQLGKNISHSLDSSIPRSFTLEQTIDILERRQEAAVLRHLRELDAADSPWMCDADAGLAIAEPRRMSARDPYLLGEFRFLSAAQIAEVMADEQRMLESRIRRLIVRRHSMQT